MFPEFSPPSTAGDASFFRIGSGEGLSELVMEFPAVLGGFLRKLTETQPQRPQPRDFHGAPKTLGNARWPWLASVRFRFVHGPLEQLEELRFSVRTALSHV